MPWVESAGERVWLDGLRCSHITPSGRQCPKPCTRIGTHFRHICAHHDIKEFGDLLDGKLSPEVAQARKTALDKETAAIGALMGVLMPDE